MRILALIEFAGFALLLGWSFAQYCHALTATPIQEYSWMVLAIAICLIQLFYLVGSRNENHN